MVNMPCVPIASIANFDGIDFCVAENVRKFYQRLGCLPVLARTALPADILVILRGSGTEIDCRDYQEVHVFNYVGQSRSGLRLRNVCSLVYIESQPSLERLRPQSDREPSLIVPARHPVYPELWRTDLRPIRYGCCHIGNYKRLSSGTTVDEVQQCLIDYITTTRSPVWGRGWDNILPKACRMGSVSLWKVLTLYAKSRVSLGLRYPYQRDHRLISSRYWLASLNGCPTVSEEPPLDVDMPGIIFRPYATSNELSLSMPERHSLVEAATDYWQRVTRRMEDALRPRIESLCPRPRSPWQLRLARLRYANEVVLRKIKSALE